MLRINNLVLIPQLLLILIFATILNVSSKTLLLWLIFSQIIIVLNSISILKPNLNSLFLLGYGFYLLLFPILVFLNLIDERFIFYGTELLVTSQFLCLFGLISYISGMSFIKVLPDNILNNGKLFALSDEEFVDSKLFLAVTISLIIIILLTNFPFGGALMKSLFIIFIVYYFHNKKWLSQNTLFSGLFLIFTLFYFLVLSDARRAFLEIILIAFIAYSTLMQKSYKLSFLLLFSLLSLLGILFLSAFTRSEFDILSFEGLSQAYENIIIFVTDTSLLSWLLMMMDFAIAYDNFLYILANIDSLGYIDFDSFKRVFGFILPRDIWLEKPLDTQILIVESRPNLGFAGGTSQSITFIGDLFWNGGIFAIFCGFFFLGLIISILDRALLSTSKLNTIIILCFAPYFFLLWRGAFSTELVYTTISIILLLSIVFFLKIINLLLPTKK